VVILVELAAGVQPGKHHFDRRHLFQRMHFHRNAAAVVLDGDRMIAWSVTAMRLQ
jgi:hypothetical protein